MGNEKKDRNKEMKHAAVQNVAQRNVLDVLSWSKQSIFSTMLIKKDEKCSTSEAEGVSTKTGKRKSEKTKKQEEYHDVTPIFEDEKIAKSKPKRLSSAVDAAFLLTRPKESQESSASNVNRKNKASPSLEKRLNASASSTVLDLEGSSGTNDSVTVSRKKYPSSTIQEPPSPLGRTALPSPLGRTALPAASVHKHKKVKSKKPRIDSPFGAISFVHVDDDENLGSNPNVSTETVINEPAKKKKRVSFAKDITVLPAPVFTPVKSEFCDQHFDTKRAKLVTPTEGAAPVSVNSLRYMHKSAGSRNDSSASVTFTSSLITSTKPSLPESFSSGTPKSRKRKKTQVTSGKHPLSLIDSETSTIEVKADTQSEKPRLKESTSLPQADLRLLRQDSNVKIEGVEKIESASNANGQTQNDVFSDDDDDIIMFLPSTDSKQNSQDFSVSDDENEAAINLQLFNYLQSPQVEPQPVSDQDLEGFRLTKQVILADLGQNTESCAEGQEDKYYYTSVRKYLRASGEDDDMSIIDALPPPPSKISTEAQQIDDSIQIENKMSEITSSRKIKLVVPNRLREEKMLSMLPPCSDDDEETVRDTVLNYLNSSAIDPHADVNNTNESDEELTSVCGNSRKQSRKSKEVEYTQDTCSFRSDEENSDYSDSSNNSGYSDVDDDDLFQALSWSVIKELSSMEDSGVNIQAPLEDPLALSSPNCSGNVSGSRDVENAFALPKTESVSSSEIAENSFASKKTGKVSSSEVKAGKKNTKYFSASVEKGKLEIVNASVAENIDETPTSEEMKGAFEAAITQTESSPDKTEDVFVTENMECSLAVVEEGKGGRENAFPAEIPDGTSAPEEETLGACAVEIKQSLSASGETESGLAPESPENQSVSGEIESGLPPESPENQSVSREPDGTTATDSPENKEYAFAAENVSASGGVEDVFSKDNVAVVAVSEKSCAVEVKEVSGSEQIENAFVAESPESEPVSGEIVGTFATINTENVLASGGIENRFTAAATESLSDSGEIEGELAAENTKNVSASGGIEDRFAVEFKKIMSASREIEGAVAAEKSANVSASGPEDAENPFAVAITENTSLSKEVEETLNSLVNKYKEVDIFISNNKSTETTAKKTEDYVSFETVVNNSVVSTTQYSVNREANVSPVVPMKRTNLRENLVTRPVCDAVGRAIPLLNVVCVYGDSGDADGEPSHNSRALIEDIPCLPEILRRFRRKESLMSRDTSM